VLGSRNKLTSTGNADLDRKQAATSPGMITWADPDSAHRCASCRWFVKKHCWLYVQQMRAREGKKNFWGPALPYGQRACRKWEKKPDDGPGDFQRSLDRRGVVPSFDDRYPKSGLLKADDLKGLPDLIVKIGRVDFDYEIGDKTRDVLRFQNDGRGLVLNQAIGSTIASLHGDEMDGWADKWVALFTDMTVKFDNKIKPGIRVRPFVPTPGDGAARMTAEKPASPSFV
jgi:hypothetical protein